MSTLLFGRMGSKHAMEANAHRMLQQIKSKPIHHYIAPRNSLNNSKFAVVSLLIGEEPSYMEAACKLGSSIDRYSSIDRVLLRLGNDHMQHTLCGWQMHAVAPIEGPSNKDSHSNRYLSLKLYTKLRVWEMVQYDAVLYVDLDTLFVGQFGSLFEVHLPIMRALEQPLAMGHNTFPDGPDFNAGVILLIPDSTLFDSLMQGIQVVQHDIETAEQMYLNAYFLNSSRIHFLPYRFNAMVSVKTEYPLIWGAEDLVILHYTCKPWNAYNCWMDGIEDVCLLWHLYPCCSG